MTDFDADALLVIIDQTEATGAPPELVEQLRGLVRAKVWRERLAMSILKTAGSPTLSRPRTPVINPRDSGGTNDERHQ